MIKLNTKIGRHSLQIEFNEMKQLHKFGEVYGNLPQKCTACGSDNIFLSYKNPKGNDYYMLECSDCKATGNFGIHNSEAKTLYWKNEPMAVYNPGQNAPSGNQPENNQPADSLDKFEDPSDHEEVPF